jgi:hypothetical protein
MQVIEVIILAGVENGGKVQSVCSHFLITVSFTSHVHTGSLCVFRRCRALSKLLILDLLSIGGIQVGHTSFYFWIVPLSGRKLSVLHHLLRRGNMYFWAAVLYK